MYDPSKNLPLLSGLVAKGVVTTAIGAAAAPAAVGAAAAFSVFEIAKAFAPDVTEHMISVLDYARFKEFLLKTHPGDLNHDLDKLIKGAMLRAVGFIKRLYLDKLKEEHELTLWQQFQRPFAEIAEVLTNMERDLASELKATTFQKEELERYLAGEHADCLDRFTNYLFAVSGVDEGDPEWQKLRAFFREQLPLLFDLSYKEALKDDANVKAFKAFEIWILEEGLRHQKQLLAGQEHILAAIIALKADRLPPEHHQVRRQLEDGVQRLSAQLSKEVAGMIIQLSRIEIKVDGVKKDTEVIIEILEKERTQPLNIPHQLTTIPAFGGDFFGRDADVKRLQQALTDSRRVVLMNGTGGVGKTTLAKWFVREHLRQYDHVCWIEVTRQDTVVEGKLVSGSIKETMADHAVLFRNLNLAFNPKEQTIDERFQLITNALRNLPGHNLFVIDNAGADAGEKGVRSLLPQPPNWHVLITSRQKLTGYELLPLDSLEPEAAKALFRANYTFDCTDEEVTALLEAIGYHTLTTELFAKTLEAHHGMLTVADLLQKVQSKTLNDVVLQQTIETEHHPEETEVFLHLMLAFDCADLTPDEKSLLSQLALLPPEPYTVKEQLAPWLGYLDAAKAGPLHQTLGQLIRKGWLTQNEHTYLLHRLLQQVIAYQIPFDWDVAKTLVKSITDVLRTVNNPNALAVYPSRKYGEFLLTGIPDAHAGTPEIARLSNNLALVYHDLGRYEEAATLLEGALKSDQTNFAPDHPTVAISQSNLALVYHDLGRYKEAATLLEGALKSDQTNFGTEHPTVAISQSNLASVYRSLGRYREASNLLEVALKSAQTDFGPDHPTVAVRQSNLATVYMEAGRYEEAVGLLEAALKSDQTNFAPDHPSIAVRQSNLALVYRNLGRYEEAVTLLEAALKSTQANYAPNHPTVAVSQSNLATVYRGLGRYEDAATLLEAALKSDQTNFGTEHPTVAVSQSNLALVYTGLGHYEEAVSLLEAALKIGLDNFGPDHPSVAVNQYNLGTVFLNLKRVDVAYRLLQNAERIFVLRLGERHPYTVDVRAMLTHVDSKR